MLLEIEMRAVSNVCGVAYMGDKELYADYLGRVTWYTSSPSITFSVSGPLGGSRLSAPVEFEVSQRHLVDS